MACQGCNRVKKDFLGPLDRSQAYYEYTIIRPLLEEWFNNLEGKKGFSVKCTWTPGKVTYRPTSAVVSNNNADNRRTERRDLKSPDG